jgi:hypothetical protein
VNGASRLEGGPPNGSAIGAHATANTVASGVLALDYTPSAGFNPTGARYCSTIYKYIKTDSQTRTVWKQRAPLHLKEDRVISIAGWGCKGREPRMLTVVRLVDNRWFGEDGPYVASG